MAEAPKTTSASPLSITKDTTINRLVGIVGCCILIFGVSAPLLHMPYFGDTNFIELKYKPFITLAASFSFEEEGTNHFLKLREGELILAIGIISTLLVLRKVYWPLLISGIGTLGLLAYTYTWAIRVTEEYAINNKDNPFASVVDFEVQWYWGVWLLIAGAILLIAAALIPSRKKRAAA